MAHADPATGDGDPKALAAAAKARGNAHFKQAQSGDGRREYGKAAEEYTAAIGHDASDHVFWANRAACRLELAKDEWAPREKVVTLARALADARRCVELSPEFVKGHMRRAAAEGELITARVRWEERRRDDAKWRREDAERRRKDREEERRAAGEGAEGEDRDSDVPLEDDEQPLEEELRELVDGASQESCERACRAGLALDFGNAQLRKVLQSLRDAGFATDTEADAALRDAAAAAAPKAEGNKCFAAKRFKEAEEHYTTAMGFDPRDHVFFSNRSACHAEQNEYEKALRDADQCVALNPQFAKGYNRRGVALYHLGRYVDAEAAAKAGLEVDASNAALKQLLEQAQQETSEPPEVQKTMHQLRSEKRQNAKLQQVLSGLNLGGSGAQVFGPGGLGGLGGGLGGLNFGGGGLGGMSQNMSEQQMRQMARAMASGADRARAVRATRRRG